jgi:molybdenum cofactor sulfurtransferase
MLSNLYGNPHSANAPAELSGHVVDSVRQKVLNFFGADPRHFDLVFTANATAGIKLVADCFRDLAERTRDGSFWYGYHKDSHTSLVGVRELAYGNSHCFESDGEVEDWLRRPSTFPSGNIRNNRLRHLSRRGGLGLLAYPGQSNMTGRRLPLSWPGAVRSSPDLTNTYSLLDGAALAMTSPLDEVFRNVDTAPDFTCVSLYKIFGFPDLGALIVRKDSGHILTLRKYFGGGTVTMVSVLGGSWHKTKGLDSATAEPHDGTVASKSPSYEIHDSLEDGTLPFHSILALDQAIDVHARIYGSMANISRYTTALSKTLYSELRRLNHPNGRPACHIYTEHEGQGYGDPRRQGATIAFNMMDPDGVYIPYSDVEKIANDNGVYVRSGGKCQHKFIRKVNFTSRKQSLILCNRNMLSRGALYCTGLRALGAPAGLLGASRMRTGWHQLNPPTPHRVRASIILLILRHVLADDRTSFQSCTCQPWCHEHARRYKQIHVLPPGDIPTPGIGKDRGITASWVSRER